MRDNPRVVSDPLSDVLTLVNAQSFVTGGLFAGGAWSLRFPVPKDVKIHAIVKGSCWMLRDGQTEPERLEAGDVFVTSEAKSFVLATDLTLEPLDALTCFSGAPGHFATLGDGRDFSMLGGHVKLDGASKALLVDVLPPLIHVHGASPEAVAVQQLLGMLAGEAQRDRAGTRLASNMLAQLLFVQALRAHLASTAAPAAGWLKALADPRLAPALRLMHGDPSRSWGLEELAASASISRSAFAAHFKSVVGVAPVAYLATWRMRLAESALRQGNTTVSSLAYSLGYASESAFSNAFKRAVGIAPKHYRSRLAA